MWRYIFLTSGLLVLVAANRPPYLTANVDIETVRENTPIGQRIFRLTAVDPENSTIHFNVSGSKGLLQVDSASGWVTVAGVLDRETLDTLEYWIVLEDEAVDGVEKNLVKIPAKLVILDENDNPPRFQNVPYDVTVKEDTPIGTTIFTTINVTDVDEIGTELKVSCGYDPQNPEACSHFSLERLTSSSTKAVYGVVLRQPLNFSLRQAHRLLLVANDGNHNVTGTLTVRVGDVQNRPPQFVGSLTGVVSEDDPTGTTIMTVKAVDGDDQDPNQIAYFLVTNPDNSFFLHQDSGKLTLVRRLDREKYLATDGTITAMVKAVEVVNGVPIETPRTTAVTALTVTVKDVNDEPPTFNRDTYSVTIDEGLPDGTPLPDLDMFVSDPDLGSNSVFSLDLQDPTGMFEVDPTVASGSTSVNIRLKSGPLDYENPNHRKFILLVVAKESLTGANHASTSTVTIMVRDINDNPPEFFQDSYVTSIVEDALPETVVTAITATDRDTGKFGTEGLEYSLLGNGADKFSVHSKSGLITVGPCDRPGSENCLDYESRPVYQLSYRAVDRGGLSAVVPLTIRLQDANDNPPKFRQPKYHAFIDEKARRFDPPFFIEVGPPNFFVP